MIFGIVRDFSFFLVLIFVIIAKAVRQTNILQELFLFLSDYSEAQVIPLIITR